MAKRKSLAQSYAKSNANRNQHNKAVSLAGRDIAPAYPPKGNIQRRDACRLDLGKFLLTYFPQAFPLPFSDDHQTVIANMQQIILNGGLMALAMPRGSGKTTISERAALWAVLFGHRKFVVVISANRDAGQIVLDNIKAEITTNPLLGADFRSRVYPIRCLDGNPRKAPGQLFKSQPTNIVIDKKQIRFPSIPAVARDGLPDGGIIYSTGLLAGIRGLSVLAPDGKPCRPDFVLVDDPQTRESSASGSQIVKRDKIIQQDILGLAGPRQKITVVTLCTVINQEDLADRLLDRTRYPQWQGCRFKLLYDFPSDRTSWDKYAELRKQAFGDGDRAGVVATDYYKARRQEMDAGAKVAWAHRYNADEISAVQHAMNLYFDNADSFNTEYQNNPPTPVHLRADVQIPAKRFGDQASGLVRGVKPNAVDQLTGFIDLHDGLLYWMVCSWADGLVGHIVDYDTFPHQSRKYFTLGNAQDTLARQFPTLSPTARIQTGLEQLLSQLHQNYKLDKLLIDSGYKPELAKAAIIKLGYRYVALSKGFSIRATDRPFSEYQRRDGERLGLHWRINAQGVVGIDTNWWKNLLIEKLLINRGNAGALTVFGKSTDHELLADHMASEYGSLVSAKGRSVIEFKARPGADNHWLDCLVGCGAGASVIGVQPEINKQVKKAASRIGQVRILGNSLWG